MRIGNQAASGEVHTGHEEKVLRVAGHSHRFPREVVTAPSLPKFKKHPDDALGDTV